MVLRSRISITLRPNLFFAYAILLLMPQVGLVSALVSTNVTRAGTPTVAVGTSTLTVQMSNEGPASVEANAIAVPSGFQSGPRTTAPGEAVWMVSGEPTGV